MFGKQKVAMLVAEFLGTAVLASVALAMLERTSFPFFLGTAMGVVYGVLWLTFGRDANAQFNPVVTLGLWTLRQVKTVQAVLAIVMQVLGGLVAWVLVSYLQNTALNKIASTKFDWRVFTAEAVGTLIFSMGVAAATFYNEMDDVKRALTVGGALFLGVTVAAFASNALLNPAVAAGVHSLSWTYVLGPLAGAVVGMNVYAWLFAPAGVVVVKSRVATPAVTKAVPAVAAKKPAARRTTAKKTTARKTARRS